VLLCQHQKHMRNTTKIVFIGAGSMCFGLSMFRDMFFGEKLQGSTVTLVDINSESLARMTALARMLNDLCGAGLKIEHTTDRRAALDGAGFVLNATAIDRNRLWKLDYEIPKKYGIRQTLGENGGPGGLSFTLRTLPILNFARDIEKLCPNALRINFSNPESRIILALGSTTTCARLVCAKVSSAARQQRPRDRSCPTTAALRCC
jgi:alpha-galactosidase